MVKKIILKLINYILLPLLIAGLFSPSVKGNTSYILVVLCISLFCISMLIDFSFTKLKIINNIELLVKYFYDLQRFPAIAVVRITIHKKINNDKYMQFIDYHPHGEKRGKKGEKYDIDKGIVRYGFSATNGDGEFSENFNDINEKLNQLIAKYNYSSVEANKRLADLEMSYYCKQILLNGNIWGLIYISSRGSHKFPEQNQLKSTLLSESADILARMVENEINQVKS